FAEALPSPEESRRSPPAALLAARSRLRMLLAAAVAREDPEAAVRLAAEDDAIAAAWRERIVHELRALASPPEYQWRHVAEDALVELRQLRRVLEAEALAAPIGTPPRHPWRRSVDSSLAARLHRALDEYETATRSIAFPHLKDPLLQQVQLAMPLAAAAGVPAEAKWDPATRLRSSLAEAIEVDQQAGEHAAQAEREVAAARPAARLTTGLRSALPEDRLAAVAASLTVVPDGDFGAAVEKAVDEHRTAQLLRLLSEAELGTLSQALGAPPRLRDDKLVTRTPDALRSVLLALGLYTGSHGQVADEAGRRLQAKIEADDYDVFLAHNAHDKPAVLALARHLRRAGIYPWLDIEQIQPGRWFQDVINAVIPRVRAAAIIFGARGLGRWQALETRTFITQCVEKGLPVIPVLLPGVDAVPAELLALRELHLVRFQTGLEDEQAFAALVWGITGERPRLFA
ncbi:MAG TPA: toll/interleukin-1 receptor domain-containing protein, partial [Thermoanaerobaculia bacterium]|nr:toll/interleukin-1 receptor domain-containing protein [Thermoanaerobaculia bacterium]